jgi:acyl-CoA reductase-like NAD-dependent aldehyde dehydrogenase
VAQYRMLIDGELVEGARVSEVINPATEKMVGLAPRASPAQLDTAISAARKAFTAWSFCAVEKRQEALRAAADAITEGADKLAHVLTQEQGKPLAAAKREVMATAAYFRHFANVTPSVSVLEDSSIRRVEVHRRPLGVVGAIVPWNFPLLLMAFKLPAALLVGNTVVLKPAATTPLATLLFGELIKDVFPAGVVNVIADENDLGAAMSSHPDIDKISFTGSTRTGRRVMAGAAPTLKRLTLELGGNDPAIVLDDVDPKEVAPKLFDAAFANSGQVCVAIKRLYVHDSIYDEICDELTQLARAAIVGDGLEQGTQLGPLQNKAQFDLVRELIDDARSRGAVIVGEEIENRPGYFIRPTIVREIADGTRLVDEEQFGPVLPVIRYFDTKEVVARANSSPFGLGGSVWSKDVGRAYALAKEINAGTVWVNQHMVLLPNIPFGGIKQSGFGVELGDDGLDEFTQPRVINVAGSTLTASKSGQ